jgi:hypothetical protein
MVPGDRLAGRWLEADTEAVPQAQRDIRWRRREMAEWSVVPTDVSPAFMTTGAAWTSITG